MEQIEKNIQLQDIFLERDQDKIFEVIIREMIIIEEIAPSKVIQVENKFEPWHDQESEEPLQ